MRRDDGINDSGYVTELVLGMRRLVLLERIKAEKARLKPAKSRRRSTNTNTAEGET
ncbi:hypothetical protein OM427_06980 [Halomonas sp. 18H]|uniref:hypothetical protein n=1 Tax=Halomonas almeriensis TaxID=308163 RepID=UPI00223153E6|nr:MULTISPECIES: hypothetical protein [Halomonas]MCW4149274.1 hypothetical protein [Halomonas sp. 18H]MDN3552173.1 hypothetical protein [Halomonas almeriensis]